MSDSSDDSSLEWPFTFACQRSGNCCAIPGGVVRVGDEDIQRIAAFLDMPVAAVRSRYVRGDGQTLKDSVDGGGRCVFLEDGQQASCRIYAVRPTKCATFPYWPELRISSALRARIAARCPGMKLLDE